MWNFVAKLRIQQVSHRCSILGFADDSPVQAKWICHKPIGMLLDDAI